MVIVSVAAKCRDELPTAIMKSPDSTTQRWKRWDQNANASLAELAAHPLGFAGLEMHLDESFELPERSRHGRLHVSDVDLDDLTPRAGQYW